MSTPRYIVLFPNSFRSRDWKRFGCDAFAREGYEVVPVQTVDAGMEPFPALVVTATNRAELEEALTEIRPADVVLNLVPLSGRTLWIYGWLRDHRVRYIVMTRGACPYSFVGRSAALGMADLLRQHRINLVNAAAGLKRRAELLLERQARDLPAPRWWLRAGERPLALFQPAYPRIGRAKVLPMEHFDVEAAQDMESPVRPEQPYAVFLDQMMAGHPDFALLGEPLPVTPERYFAQLDRLFALVERDFGLNVLIARHPKADMVSVGRYSRPIVEVSSAAAVHGSSLVLCHDTTALSYVVQFRRPVMFLTSDELERGYIGVSIARASSWLGQRRTNIDHLPDKLRFPEVSEEQFARFDRAFLRGGEPPFAWKQVVRLVSAKSERSPETIHAPAGR